MVDMTGIEVNINDKVIYVSASSKELKMGYLISEIVPRKGIVDSTKFEDYVESWRRFYEKEGREYTEEELFECRFGDKVVIPKQIYKVNRNE